MAEDHTPYDYGDAETEAIGDDPPQEQQHGLDTVIVDGSVTPRWCNCGTSSPTRRR